MRRVERLVVTFALTRTMTSCGNGGSGVGSSTPDYYFATVAAARDAHMMIAGPSPTSLAEALPNRRYSIRWTDITFQFSELVVTGEVIEARYGPAYAHRDNDTIYPVAFDDPRAVEHTFDVVIRVEEEFGAVTGGETVTFRMGSLNAADLEGYKKALQSLGRTVVFLQNRQDRDGPVWIPIEQGALVGQVSSSGALRFPAMDPEHAEGFSPEMSTLRQLRETAKASPRISSISAEFD